MPDHYLVLGQTDLFKIMEHTAPGDKVPIHVFAVRGVLFKSRSGQYGSSLHMWTPTGWQLFYHWDQHIPLEPDLHSLALKTALALDQAIPSQ
ncbi:MAG: hypothetical protein BroJett011_76280 [Chloroflexota bacterium]|nr:MAG: hypothetical protein BroJett011_76280 [Chloroflexota bacterium]